MLTFFCGTELGFNSKFTFRIVESRLANGTVCFWKLFWNNFWKKLS